MYQIIKKIFVKTIKELGFDLPRRKNFSLERNGEFLEIYKKIKKYSTHSIQRLYALYKAVLYLAQNNIPGDLVECGVFRGGSSMLCALTLLSIGDTKRKLFLYDTYEGMVKPTDKDITFFKVSAMEMWNKLQNNRKKWNFCPLEEVKKNMYSTGYPKDNFVFIKGKTQETIPTNIPSQIALLHLDTDWFESTYHELSHLYPLLSSLGVLIVDDYGTWLGQKEAVDKYIAENRLKILLNRIDSFGYIGVKTIIK